MSLPFARRTVLFFVLAVLAATPWAAAEPPQARGAAPAPLLAQLWSQVAGFMADIGCIADPNGIGCNHIDIGCIMDPNGGCHDTAVAPREIGCGIDPGGCAGGSAPSQIDIGCGYDPNGGGCGQ